MHCITNQLCLISHEYNYYLSFSNIFDQSLLQRYAIHCSNCVMGCCLGPVSSEWADLWSKALQPAPAIYQVFLNLCTVILVDYVLSPTWWLCLLEIVAKSCDLQDFLNNKLNGKFPWIFFSSVAYLMTRYVLHGLLLKKSIAQAWRGGYLIGSKCYIERYSIFFY